VCRHAEVLNGTQAKQSHRPRDCFAIPQLFWAPISMVRIMDRFSSMVEKINLWAKRVCIVASGAIFLLAMAQILFRYVFKISAPWTEEAARYLMIWMALLASGLAFKNGEHFNIDFLTQRMRPRLQVSLSLWISLITGLFILSIILWGIPFAKLGFFTISPGLQITMFLPYLAVPVGGALMLLNLTFFILRLLKRRGEKEVREEP
jgi:TRAP-type C4-dicarboxylate transport system permease small subunit